MKTVLFFFLIPVATGIRAQRVVVHPDLIRQSLVNTSFKVGMNELYADKMEDIANHRANTASYASIIEEVQRKMFSSLTNVDGAIRNGRTLYYVGQRIPEIFKNLETASALAAGKPYLVALATEQGSVIIERIVKLQTQLQDFILKNDPKVLITPIQRERFVYEIYQNINIIYSLSGAMVSTFKLHNLQDAIDKIVPYKMYVNMDKTIVQDIGRKLKL